MEQIAYILRFERRFISCRAGGVGTFDGIGCTKSLTRLNMTRSQAGQYKRKMVRAGYRVIEMPWGRIGQWIEIEAEAEDDD